ncbi:tRNA lysidine(34) synthetase TilS [Paenacidovorax monticola]|uniref:tRNA(Ile)-lysidine synthase n=1 Tax=Paenacidovorax monticola TaxID=1926868 RepID=A0A7H0HFY1_9BURK|nr:tRNA lysidine(34) synthetase TilS [Paenacidovorax monticola]QNP59447.1 tRNA lysidine(34) synthetase TilS [Paenacidovorax monticola]
MTQRFDEALSAFAPALPLAVGLSGGADSTALLLACAQRWPGQVHAIHVHHGLQAAADGFERHCIQLCERLRVPLQVQRVDARAAPGQSPEDAARRARYEAFEAAVRHAGAPAAIQSMALAQHADDQVETLLLALSRGAGVAGLAAMPMHWRRAGLDWHRPLLRVPGRAVRDWLRERGEAWVEDPTNTDERYTRNRIRARLLPALEATFPQFRDTFARSSLHAAQAQELLLEMAGEDLAEVGVPPRIRALRSLGPARQANVLRHWLRTAHQTTPGTAQLDELQSQLAACATRGHRIRIRVGRGFVVRQGECLGFEPQGAP